VPTDAPALLLTVRDVAEWLAVGDEAVCGLIAAGTLKAVNVGLGKKKPRWRITPEALEQFLAARTAGAAPGKPSRRSKSRQSNTIEFF
jgi:excisionase family DNA binding protein